MGENRGWIGEGALAGGGGGGEGGEGGALSYSPSTSA